MNNYNEEFNCLVICSSCTEIAAILFNMDACKIKEIIKKIFITMVRQIRHFIPKGVSVATLDNDLYCTEDIG